MATSIPAGDVRLISALLASKTCSCEEHKKALVRARALGDYLAKPKHKAEPDDRQLVLLRVLQPDDVVKDCPLICKVRAAVCVKRQIENDVKRAKSKDPNRSRELSRHDGKRGTAGEFPTCVTAHCAIGRSVRAAIGDAAAEGIRHGEHHDLAGQRAAHYEAMSHAVPFRSDPGPSFVPPTSYELGSAMPPSLDEIAAVTWTGKD